MKPRFFLSTAMSLVIILAVLLLGQLGAAPRVSATSMARVRVMHAVADAPPVDVLVNGMPAPALAGIAYKDVTDYVTIPSGTYAVAVVVPPGVTPVLTATLTLADDTAYTVVALGTVEPADAYPLALLAVVDDNEVPADGMAKARFFHLVPGAPDVAAAVQGGPVLITGVSYGDATEYIEVPAGTYDLELQPIGIPLPIPVPGVVLAPKTVYSFFAVGSALAPEIVPSVDAEPTYALYLPIVINSQ